MWSGRDCRAKVFVLFVKTVIQKVYTVYSTTRVVLPEAAQFDVPVFETSIKKTAALADRTRASCPSPAASSRPPPRPPRAGI